MGTIAIPAAEKGLNSSESAPTYRGPFAIMTVFNDILIPRFKEAFTLNYFEAMLVQFAFFGAYFIGSLVYFIISVTTGDPIARIGYKNGVVTGLLISASGSVLFWSAARIWRQLAAPPN
jgi:FHS family L-fucose permease-like MFS transporter